MPPTLITERLSAAREPDIRRAGELLLTGNLVAFPTETVYGLGANALDATAIEKIFVAKQRPHWDPLIVHIAGLDQLAAIATLQAADRYLLDILMASFWPGPLTLLLPRTSAVSDLVTAARPLVGVRIPSHPVAQALLRAAGVPIAAPSANRFGHISPVTAAHVLADLDGRIDAVLDGGPTQVGLESTVAEVRNGTIILYRQGAVTAAMIEAVPGAPKVRLYTPPTSEIAPASLPSPGVGIRHYAPDATLVLVPGDQKAFTSAIVKHKDQPGRLGVMLPDTWSVTDVACTFPWGRWDQPEILAQRLYTGLRYLDHKACTRILCPVPEGEGIAEAIRDRLEKAAR